MLKKLTITTIITLSGNICLGMASKSQMAQTARDAAAYHQDLAEEELAPEEIVAFVESAQRAQNDLRAAAASLLSQQNPKLMKIQLRAARSIESAREDVADEAAGIVPAQPAFARRLFESDNEASEEEEEEENNEYVDSDDEMDVADMDTED